MPHPLIDQLRYTRGQWLRALEDVTAEEAVRHFEPMNCISWAIGHLAWQEQRYWLQEAQNITVAPEVMLCAYGQPMTTPPLADMWAAWQRVVEAADPFLDSLTIEMLQTHAEASGQRAAETLGTRIYHVFYHYFYHIGETQAIRQLLGHKDLPGFPGGPIPGFTP